MIIVNDSSKLCQPQHKHYTTDTIKNKPEVQNFYQKNNKKIVQKVVDISVLVRYYRYNF